MKDKHPTLPTYDAWCMAAWPPVDLCCHLAANLVNGYQFVSIQQQVVILTARLRAHTDVGERPTA